MKKNKCILCFPKKNKIANNKFLLLLLEKKIEKEKVFPFKKEKLCGKGKEKFLSKGMIIFVLWRGVLEKGSELEIILIYSIKSIFNVFEIMMKLVQFLLNLNFKQYF